MVNFLILCPKSFILKCNKNKFLIKDNFLFGQLIIQIKKIERKIYIKSLNLKKLIILILDIILQCLSKHKCFTQIKLTILLKMSKSKKKNNNEFKEFKLFKILISLSKIVNNIIHLNN